MFDKAAKARDERIGDSVVAKPEPLEFHMASPPDVSWRPVLKRLKDLLADRKRAAVPDIEKYIRDLRDEARHLMEMMEILADMRQ